MSGAVLNPSVPGEREALRAALRGEETWLVACLCAAWCRSCGDYRTVFDSLSARHPDWVFVWVDIEDEADLVGDLDVENFPTLLVQRGESVRFCGPVMPQAGVSQRMLEALAEAEGAGAAGGWGGGIDLRAGLLGP